MQTPDQLTQQHAPQLVELINATQNPSGNYGLQEALKVLEQWEVIPGYCSLLYYLILNKQVDDGTRFIAISCFKNAVHKYWLPRNNSKGSISNEEKTSIRENFSQLFNEENNLNALHIGLLYAKIARLDFPRDWPNPLHQLIQLQEEPNITPLRKLRLLSALKFTVKSLSSKVLTVARTRFQSATTDILPYIYNLWMSTNQQIANSLKSGNLTIEIVPVLEACKLSLQTLKPLIQYGVSKVNENQIAMEFISNLLPSLREYIHCAKQNTLESVCMNYIRKYIIVSCKIIVELHKSKPGPFEPFLIPCLELMWGELATLSVEETTDSTIKQRLVVYCLRYIKDVINTHYYQKPRNTGSVLAETEREQQIIRELFTSQRITELAEMIISKYLRLTKVDLELWENDPEEVISETAADDYSITVHPAAQALFSTCQSKFDEVLDNHIVQLLQKVAYNENESLEQVILRDACYQALGLSYDTCFANIPFESWLSTFFLPDLNQKNRQHFMILSRRIAWLLGRWVTRITDECRPTVYQILMKLMEDEDLVIQMTAADGLSKIIDDLNFDIAPFASYVPICIRLLFQLLEKCHEVPSKMQLINNLAIIIDQAHSEIHPFAKQILESLAKLWNTNTEEKGMVMSAIIRSIERLVLALGYKTAQFYDILLPMIRISTDITAHESIYTMEDGLSVWLHILQQAPKPESRFLELFINIPRIIDSTFEHTVNCIHIVDSYILLGGEEFLSNFGSQVIVVYSLMLGHVNESGTEMIVKSMNTLVECFPIQGPMLLEELLIKILSLIFSEKEPKSCKREYSSLIMLVIISNPNYFIQLVNKIQQQHQIEIIPQLLEFSFNLMEKESDKTIRKKYALALCDLLPIGGKNILTRLTQIIDLVLNVLHDNQNSEIQELLGLDDDDDDEEDDDDPTGSVVNERKYQLYKKNREMMKVSLQEFALQKMQQAAEAYGTDFQTALSTVPPPFIEALKNKNI